jgi:2-keto-4-pentenoate hydratase/2-oxohepta-3-ene-1,7-dioic acid hydratase in catechol pathway
VEDRRHLDLNFTVAHLISFGLRCVTLAICDVIFAGTPAEVGVAAGRICNLGGECVMGTGHLGAGMNTAQ